MEQGPHDFPSWRLSVAPMMDWTDRHCRYFHRQMSAHALLYTEMVTSAALVRGGARHLLAHDPAEHPVALQLGGSDPAELAQAARIGAEAGFDEINLNVGCPSDRVQAGTFGAVLMLRPALVADCVAAMVAAVPAGVPVTVKCRLGVDEQDPRAALPALLEAIEAAGAARAIVHARKAWLQGLSPKQNREVPPLDYALAAEAARAFPGLKIALNGGVGTLAEVRRHLDAGFAGVMVGRAAYQTPAEVLLGADAAVFGGGGLARSAEQVAEAMRPHIARHLAAGGRLHDVTRHMLGLFHGRPGARAWRRTLGQGATAPGAGLELLDAALAAVTAPPLAQAG